LTDVFNKEDTVEIYIELPVMENGDVQVRTRGRSVEVKAKNFRKVIRLPTKEIVGQIASSEYKNGVLRIVIPKKLGSG
jgi:HSP20 family molecular chaperone IbpA